MLCIDADKDSDNEGGGGGLFDSDDDDEEPAAKKPAAKPLSKRERMEALQAKKRQESAATAAPLQERKEKRKENRDKPEKEGGYESEDSYDSAEYVRTKEDNDFIDTEGDDEDAIKELYAEQHFDDDRGEAEEEPGRNKKSKGSGSSRSRSEREELEADDDNPIMQAVNRMKRIKKVQKKFSELEDEAKVFLGKMERAADEDDEAITQKRPATKKLTMLNEVCDMLAKRDMTRVLLDLDLLAVCKRWVQPLPNGTLGNVTVRQRLLESISLITGENGITANDLKRSEFGKVVMVLYMHKSETPTMKRQLKSLIEQWSRPIFQKSGNMRDLERVHHERGGTGLAGISRMQQQEQQSRQHHVNAIPTHRGGKDQDLNSLIQSGAKGKSESGINRVRVPFSKGFQFTVRPTSRVTGDVDRRRAAPPAKESRGNLAKRMIEKNRKVSKNQRSANVSVEGRQVK